MLLRKHTSYQRQPRARSLIRTCAAKASPSVGIVGAGSVGSAIASSLIHKNIAHNIKLTDINMDMCEGVALDLQDEAFVTGTLVNAVPIKDMNSCDIIIITAGAKQRPGEPRTDLVKRNAVILKSILDALFPLKSDTIVLLVSNPVDILTALAQKWCSPYIPREQVIGSGTYLDTQRFRVALAKRFHIGVKSIHAYVIGEHGDSQVFAHTSSMIGGTHITNYAYVSEAEIGSIEKEVRTKAYEIIKRTGATYHGIGACVATIAESILLDKNEVLPISVYVAQYDTYMGWPSILGRRGIVHTIPLSLCAEELKKLDESAKVIKGSVDNVLAT
jgi:L-lactate dehydrogenase